MFLKTYLNNLDYKVCVVSSRTNAELFGIHSFPEFMLQHNLDESSKIINFNHYIKELEVSEKPEIIIIGVPGGIMPVSEKHSDNYIPDFYDTHFQKQLHIPSVPFRPDRLRYRDILFHFF